jgi:hypothetical protein
VDAVEGVLVLPVRSVHTIGMRCTIDVAFCDAAGTVLKVVTMPPGRPGRMCWAARQVIEAPEGAFAAWGVQVGDVLVFYSDGIIEGRNPDGLLVAGMGRAPVWPGWADLSPRAALDPGARASMP